MKPLTDYKKNGFDYFIVARQGDYAVFLGKGYKEGRAEGQTVELIHIQVSKAGERFGKHFEAAEHPPHNELWGTHGWTYPPDREEEAILRMHSLAQIAEKKALEEQIQHE